MIKFTIYYSFITAVFIFTLGLLSFFGMINAYERLNTEPEDFWLLLTIIIISILIIITLANNGIKLLRSKKDTPLGGIILHCLNIFCLFIFFCVGMLAIFAGHASDQEIFFLLLPLSALILGYWQLAHRLNTRERAAKFN